MDDFKFVSLCRELISIVLGRFMTKIIEVILEIKQVIEFVFSGWENALTSITCQNTTLSILVMTSTQGLKNMF